MEFVGIYGGPIHPIAGLPRVNTFPDRTRRTQTFGNAALDHEVDDAAPPVEERYSLNNFPLAAPINV